MGRLDDRATKGGATTMGGMGAIPTNHRTSNQHGANRKQKKEILVGHNKRNTNNQQKVHQGNAFLMLC
jgi:hypothetical protein